MKHAPAVRKLTEQQLRILRGGAGRRRGHSKSSKSKSSKSSKSMSRKSSKSSKSSRSSC